MHLQNVLPSQDTELQLVPIAGDNARHQASESNSILSFIERRHTVLPVIDVRLDFENLYYGLVKMGWRANMRLFHEALHTALDEIGQIANIEAYADFLLLNRNAKYDVQRDLIKQGIRTNYQINRHGKNTADMAIANDIRTLLEMSAYTTLAVDIIVLGTGDRDFCETIRAAKRRGKQVVILAVENSLSRDLIREANAVCYINRYLPVKQ